MADATFVDTPSPACRRAAIVLSKDTAYVQEGFSGTALTVQLREAPTADVTLSASLTGALAGLASLTTTSFTFTTSNWNTAQNVGISVPDNSADDTTSADGTFTVGIAWSASSTDAQYDAGTPTWVPSSSSTITVYDDERAAVLVVDPVNIIREGESATVSVVLASQPSADVVVSALLSTSQPGDSVDGPLTFTSGNWNTAQSFTVTAVTDGVNTVGSSTVLRTMVLALSMSSADTHYNPSVFEPSSSPEVRVYDAEASCTRTCVAGQYAGTDASGVVQCLDCPAGYYCAGGDCTVKPTACSAGTYRGTVRATTPGDCLACASGSYADYAGAALCEPCPAGNDCTDPAATPTLCAAGTYSAANVAACTACPDGFYADQPGASACRPCPEGYECPASAKDQAPSACADGTYAAAQSTSCTTCPAGSNCAGMAATPVCPTGMYTTGTNGYCIPCPPGRACLTPDSTPTICPAGTFSPAGQGSCTTCAIGVSAAGAATCSPCPAGSECSDPANPTLCPPGYASPTGLASCVACTAGTYAVSNGTAACAACPAGQYCPSTSALPMDCAAGSVSAAGSDTCSPCAAGQTHNAARDACIDCPAGYECSDPAAPQPCPAGTHGATAASRTACSACSAGNYCPGGALAEAPCPANHYANGPSAAACAPCPGGFSCADGSSTPAQCSAGTYSPEGSMSCTACAAGTFCPAGSSAETACPSGQYAAAGASSCTLCPAGSYCSDPALAPVACASGHYSLSGATGCTVCPAGHACAAANALPVLCAAGELAPSGSTSCSACPAGYYCADPSQVAQPCPAGTYSTGSALQCTYCPAGAQCPSPDGTGITTCTAGYYAVAGAASCTQCSAGHMCPFPSLAVEIPCRPGFDAPAGSALCDRCAAGYACAGGGSVAAACTGGTYAGPGAEMCRSCPPGFSCVGNQGPPVACSEGSYSLDGELICTQCPAGSACPVTNAAPVPCSASSPATYAAAGSTHCDECPGGSGCTTSAATPCSPGQYAVHGDGTCRPCPAGSECPTTDAPPLPCAPGYYSASSATSCTLCPAGSECPTTTGSPSTCPAGMYSLDGATACSFCGEGYYCSAGSTEPTPAACNVAVGEFFNPLLTGTVPPALGTCPPGTYGNPSITCGTSEEHACLACEPGYVCAGVAARALCSAGHFCPGNSGAETPCPAGTYNPATGSTAITACMDCAAGEYCPEGSPSPVVCPAGSYCPDTPGGFHYYCPPGSFGSGTGFTTVSNCSVCPTGHYCPGDGAPAYACPAGTYNNVTGITDDKLCQPCVPGTACVGTGLTLPDSACDAGHWCPAGTAAPSSFPCPPGTYSDATDNTQASDCLTCPAGFACVAGTGGGSPGPAACAAGHWCPAGTTVPTEFECPPGTYTAATNLDDPAQCTACPAGSYCVGGQGSPSGACAAGHFCPVNSSRADANPCAAGTYYAGTDATAQADCTDCPPGSYCFEGSTSPDPCPAGTFANTSNTQAPNRTGAGLPAECATCPGGYECASGTVNPVQCGAGHYSPEGADTCEFCLYGHFCDVGGISATEMGRSKRCAAGVYCPTGVSVVPTAGSHPCPPGFYCQDGAGEEPRAPYPTPCAPGTSCPGGACGVCGECPAGSYCLEGASSPTGPCAAGFYCPTNSTREDAVPCPGGTYRATTSAASLSDCAQCPYGSVCAAGTATPADCPLGAFCVPGSAVPDLCPPGRFGNNTNLGNYTDCFPCLPGTYCDEPGLTAPKGLCDPGYYCVLGSPYKQPNPLVNTLPGAVDMYGDICPRGAYCPAGSYVPLPCPRGTYMNETGQASDADCTTCAPGYYCGADSSPGPSGPCSPGYFCNGSAEVPTQWEAPAGTYTEYGDSAPIPCPVGTYNSQTAQGACQPCDAGYYCSQLGMTAPQPCAAGTYCPTGSKAEQPCPIGTFNPNSLSTHLGNCTACTPGSYCAAVKQTSPTGLCNAGFYCTGAAELPDPVAEAYGDPCPTGHYCPAGSSAPQACPPGTYGAGLRLRASTDCSECTPGKYCPVAGMGAPAGDCDAGYYCAGGARAARPSPTNATGGACPAGNYCPAGSAVPVPCSAGSYANVTGMAACLVCPAGTSCAGLGTINPAPCAPGYYCEQGTGAVAAVPCPVGTYNPGFGASNATACRACPGGQYCGGAGLSAPSGNCTAGFSCPPGSTSALGGHASGTPASRPCPAGYTCPAGAVVPVSCAPGTFNPSTQQDEPDVDCLLCTPGSYCNQSALAAPSGPCADGYYCPQGASSSRPSSIQATARGQVGGELCPAGSYCPPGTGTPLGCPAGTYQDTAGAGAAGCQGCPAGYWCGVNVTLYGAGARSGACPAGHWCPANTSVPTAHPCPPGTFNNATHGASAAACVACTPGQFCEGFGNVATDGLCAPGYYCSGSAITASPPNASLGGGMCKAGEVCPAGSASPIPCAGGHYCASAAQGNTTPDGECYAGYYCVGGAWTPAPSGQLGTYGAIGDVCSPGHYCPNGTITPVGCPPGTFNQFTGARAEPDCQACSPGSACPNASTVLPPLFCPAGHYCPAGTASPTTYPCPAGHFCDAGQPAPVPCPPGTYQNMTAQAVCAPCPARHVCGLNATSTPALCPPGSYCPGSVTRPDEHLCPAGTFSNASALAAASECTPCSPGMYCAAAGLTQPTGWCQAGHYCASGASSPAPTEGYDAGYTCSYNGSRSAAEPSTGDLCPPGHYCQAGSGAPSACPAGTYMPSWGSQNVSACLACPPGQLCSGTGLAAPSGPCTAGYFCPGGDDIARHNCTVGHACPGGNTAPAPCHNGTYSPAPGATACLACPPGRVCPAGASVATPAECPTGHYCPGGAITGTEFPCPAATFSNETGLTALSQCKPCSAGSYCAAAGLAAPSGPCAAGHWCSSGSSVAAPVSGAMGSVCPAGHYCPAGVAAPIACPAGTLTNATALGSTALVDCAPCPPGKVCSGTGLTEPTASCAAGFYCPGGDDIPRMNCTAGHFCAGGNTAPMPCENGTYSPAPGATACLACPPGRVCPAGASVATPAECPTGHYCPGGAITGTEFPCPAGTFNNLTGLSAQAQCTPCSVGSFCASAGLSEPTGLCATGYWCAGGASTPTPTDGVTGQLCSPGHVCYAGALTPAPSLDSERGTVCPMGTYCAAGATTPAGCPAGTYGPAAGSRACLSCPAGSVCPANSTVPLPCPVGGYCPGNTSLASQCPAGTVGNRTGLRAAADCAQCPPGRYCVGGVVAGSCAAGYFCESGADSPTGSLCPAGHYCPAGTVSALVCPNGTVRATPGASSPAQCTSCPGGYRCEAANPVPFPCEPGWYCEAGRAPVRCPVGTANVQFGASAVSNCTACPAGHLCNAQGIGNLVPYACPAGSYCPSGSSAAAACPPGTLRATAGAAAQADCAVCPGGFVCPSAATQTGTPCPSGVLCPAGSTAATGCPAGSYCPPRSAAPVQCPAGFYCPSNSSVPVLCPSRQYCPAGSVVPLTCPLGARSLPDTSNLTRSSFSDACAVCPAGTYNDEPGLGLCKPCPAGYVCLGGTPTAAPSSATADRGYPCPAGYYCPEGSSQEIACAAGSFNSLEGAGAASNCVLCAEGTYGPLPGASQCFPCSASSSSSVGSTTCDCIGANRRFQPSDGWCICEPLHEYFDESYNRRSEEDGTSPCQPMVYTVCSDGEARDAGTGLCVPVDSAVLCGSEECLSGSGTYDVRTGLCECTGLPDMQTLCDADCRARTTTMAVDAATGLLRVDKYSAQNGTDSTLVRLQDIPGFLGDVSCSPGLKYGSQSTSTTSARGGMSATSTATSFTQAELDSAAARGEFQQCGMQTVAASAGAGFFGQYGSSATVGAVLGSGYEVPLTAGNSSSSARLLRSQSSTVHDLLAAGELANDPAALARMPAANSPLVQSMLWNTPIPERLAAARLHVPAELAEELARSRPEIAFELAHSARRLQSTGSSSTWLGWGDASASDISAEAPTVHQPIVCLRLGDGVVWDLRGGRTHYPVYVKDSLLNTNPTFDYGAFRRLEQAMKSTANVTMFAFTFREPGVYDFEDAGTPAQRMIVAVMEPGSRCPTEGEIVPLTTSNLIQVGARRSDDIVYAINWRTVAGFLVAFALAISSVVWACWFVHSRAWEKGRDETAKYKAAGKKVELSKLHERSSVTTQSVVEGTEQAAAGGPTTVLAGFATGSAAGGAADAGAAALQALAARGNAQLDLARWDVDDLDLAEVIERVEQHAGTMHAGFLAQSKQSDSLMSALQEEAAALKRMLARAQAEQKASDATGSAAAQQEQQATALLTELRRSAGFDASNTALETELMAALLELTEFLQPGEECIADDVVTEMRDGAVLSPAELEQGNLEMLDDCLPDMLTKRLHALQAAADRVASALSAEASRREAAAPLWKSVAELGVVSKPAVAGAVEASTAAEERVRASMRRILEALEPFVLSAPNFQTDLHGAVSEYAPKLAGTAMVPSPADMYHIRARKQAAEGILAPAGKSLARRMSNLVGGGSTRFNRRGSDMGGPAGGRMNRRGSDFAGPAGGRMNRRGSDFAGPGAPRMNRRGSDFAGPGAPRMNRRGSDMGGGGGALARFRRRASGVIAANRMARRGSMEAAASRRGVLQTHESALGQPLSTGPATPGAVMMDSGFDETSAAGPARDARLLGSGETTATADLGSPAVIPEEDEHEPGLPAVDDDEQWLDREDYVHSVDRTARRANATFKTLVREVLRVLGALRSSLPGLMTAVEEHRAEVAQHRDVLLREVESVAETAKMAAERAAQKEKKATNHDAMLAALMAEVRTVMDAQPRAGEGRSKQRRGKRGAAADDETASVVSVGSDLGALSVDERASAEDGHSHGQVVHVTPELEQAMEADVEKDEQTIRQAVNQATAAADLQEREAAAQNSQAMAADIDAAVGVLDEGSADVVRKHMQDDHDALEAALQAERVKASAQMEALVRDRKAELMQAQLVAVQTKTEDRVSQAALERTRRLAEEQAAAQREAEAKANEAAAAAEAEAAAARQRVAEEAAASEATAAAKLQHAKAALDSGSAAAVNEYVAAASTLAALEADKDGDDSKAQIRAAVEASTAAMKAELEKVRADADARVAAAEARAAAERADMERELEERLAEAREAALTDLQTQQQEELAGAAPEARAALAAKHEQALAEAAADLDAKEEAARESMQRKLERQAAGVDATRAAIRAEFDKNCAAVREAHASEQDRQLSKLKSRLAERRAARKAAQARKQREELAEAQAAAAAASAAEQEAAAAKLRAVQAAQAAQREAEERAAAAEAQAIADAEAAAAAAAKAAADTEAQLAAIQAEHASNKAAVQEATDREKRRMEASLQARLRERKARRKAMAAAKRNAVMAATGDEQAAQAAEASLLAEAEQKAQQEEDSERAAMAGKLQRLDDQASAQMQLLQAQTDGQVSLAMAQGDAAGQGALSSLQGSGDAAASFALARARDEKVGELRRRLIEQERARIMAEEAAEQEANAMQSELHAQSQARDALVAGIQSGQTEEERAAAAAAAARDQAALEELRRAQEAEAAAAAAADAERAVEEAAASAAAAAERRKQAVEEKRREMQARLQAAQASTAEEFERVKAEAEAEMAAFEAAQEEETHRQSTSMKKRLEARRQRKARALKRKQEEELAAKVAEQRKQAAELEAQAAQQREKAALAAALGAPEMDESAKTDAIEAVLTSRHSQETASLLATQLGERSAALRRALEDVLDSKREAEAALLEKLGAEGASQVQIDQALGELSAEYVGKQDAAREAVLQELEVRHAREQLDLRQRQLAQIAEAFRDLAPEQVLRRAAAEEAAREAEEIAAFQAELADAQQARLASLQQAQADAAQRLKAEAEAEMAALEAEHEAAMAAERERSTASMARRREQLRKDQEEARQRALADSSALDEETRDRIMREFAENQEALEVKLETERARQEATLKARLEARRHKKRAAAEKRAAEKRAKQAEDDAKAITAAKASAPTAALGRKLTAMSRHATASSMRGPAMLNKRGSAMQLGRLPGLGIAGGRARGAALGSARSGVTASLMQDRSSTGGGAAPAAAQQGVDSTAMRELAGRLARIEEAITRIHSAGAGTGAEQAATGAAAQVSINALLGRAPEPGMTGSTLEPAAEADLSHRAVVRLQFLRRVAEGVDTAIVVKPARALPGDASRSNAVGALYWQAPHTVWVRADRLSGGAAQLYDDMLHILAAARVSPQDFTAAPLPKLAAEQQRLQLSAGSTMFASMNSGAGPGSAPPTARSAAAEEAPSQSLRALASFSGDDMRAAMRTASASGPALRAAVAAAGATGAGSSPRGSSVQFSNDAIAQRLAGYRAIIQNK